MGPRTNPCGMPHCMFCKSGAVLLIAKNCYRLLRYEANQLFDTLLIPYCSYFFKTILWFTVSKALLKSKNILQEKSLSSIALWILSIMMRIA